MAPPVAIAATVSSPSIWISSAVLFLVVLRGFFSGAAVGVCLGRELILVDLLGSAEGSDEGLTAALRGIVTVGGQVSVGCVSTEHDGVISFFTRLACESKARQDRKH